TPDDEVEFKYIKEIGGESPWAFVFSEVEFEGGTINYLPSSMVCFGGDVIFDNIDPVTGGHTDSEQGGSISYQWEVNYNGGGFEDIDGGTGEFHTTTETALGTYIYKRKAIDFCGAIAYTNEITIIRSTLGPLTGGYINYPSSTTVCHEEVVSFDDIDPVSGGLSDPELGGIVAYEWEVNYNGGGFEDIDGATQEFYTTTETAPGTYEYRRKATDNCGGVAYTNVVTIIRLMGGPLDAGTITYLASSIV